MPPVIGPAMVTGHSPGLQPQRRKSAGPDPVDGFETLLATADREAETTAAEPGQDKAAGSETESTSSDTPVPGIDLITAPPPWDRVVVPPSPVATTVRRPTRDGETSLPGLTRAMVQSPVLAMPWGGLGPVTGPRIISSSPQSIAQDSDQSASAPVTDTCPMGSADFGTAGRAVEEPQQAPRLPIHSVSLERHRANPDHAGVSHSSFSASPSLEGQAELSRVGARALDDRQDGSKSVARLQVDLGPPNTGLSPAAQVLDLIESAAPVSKPGALPPYPGPVAAGDLRVLRMRLHPDSLGEVDVALRRRGKELHIEIAVTRQVAADAIQADIGVLSERIGLLLAGEDTHSIHIVTQLADNAPASPSSQAGRYAGETFAGGAASGSGERPPPRKQDAPTPRKEREGHEESQPVSGAAGLVV